MKKIKGGDKCWADTKINSYIIESEGVETFDLSPNTKLYNEMMKKKLLGERSDQELSALILQLLSIVNCDSFQNIKKIILSNNKLNDKQFELIQNDFIQFLNKSNIEILDIRGNNDISEKKVQYIVNLGIENKYNKKIVILNDYDDVDVDDVDVDDDDDDDFIDNDNDNATNANTNDSDIDDNITLFVPEIIFDQLNDLLVNKNNRKNIFNNLKSSIEKIKIENNLKDKISKINQSNVENKATGVFGLGIGFLGGDSETHKNEYSDSGVKIIIPKNTIYSFISMNDKNNVKGNINNLITSIKNIQLLNKFNSVTYKQKSNNRKTKKMFVDFQSRFTRLTKKRNP
jgi:hypothetical protein